MKRSNYICVIVLFGSLLAAFGMDAKIAYPIKPVAMDDSILLEPGIIQQGVAQTSMPESPTAQSPIVQSSTAQSPTAQSPTAQSSTVQSSTVESSTVESSIKQSPIVQSETVANTSKNKKIRAQRIRPVVKPVEKQVVDDESLADELDIAPLNTAGLDDFESGFDPNMNQQKKVVTRLQRLNRVKVEKPENEAALLHHEMVDIKADLYAIKEHLKLMYQKTR